MKDFTVSLALLDYIPVIAFGIAILILGIQFGSTLFLVGATLSLLAGIMKATWKLILGISGKNLRFLNKPFVPIQSIGMILMLIAVAINFRTIDFSRALSFPSVLFFAVWIFALATMFWYRKNRFVAESARCNWVAEIINSIGQLGLLFAVLFM